MPKLTTKKIETRAQKPVTLKSDKLAQFTLLETEKRFYAMFGPLTFNEANPDEVQGVATQAANLIDEEKDGSAREVLTACHSHRQFVPEQVLDTYDRLYNEFGRMTREISMRDHNVKAYQDILESTDNLEFAALALQRQREQQTERDRLARERNTLENVIASVHAGNDAMVNDYAKRFCTRLNILPDQLDALISTPSTIPGTIQCDIGYIYGLKKQLDAPQTMPQLLKDNPAIEASFARLTDTALTSPTKAVLEREKKASLPRCGWGASPCGMRPASPPPRRPMRSRSRLSVRPWPASPPSRLATWYASPTAPTSPSGHRYSSASPQL